jgi:hypothetical protein
MVVLGGFATVLGAVDPLEGSILILGGTALVLLGTYMGRHPRPMLVYWVWVVGLVFVGVASLWGFSAVGGLGGDTGRSMWWMLTMLPYAIGWLMAFSGLILRLVRALKDGRVQRHVVSI